ncbi:MAG: hypothetical protein QNJ44_04700 [Rhodobacter sp.]|nr:hypothetical protein [Rhodobacter sp.]
MADESTPISCKNTETRDWYAWIDTMPPGPNMLYVVGEAWAPNPGVEGFLVPSNPQGINPRILLLDIHFYQRPGIWPQVMTWIPVRYQRPVSGPKAYSDVTILCEGDPIAQIPVEIAS